MMLHGENNPTLARESVFSTVMIICGGVVGFCLTFGGLRHEHQELKRQGTNAYLAMLTALAVLTLVLPNFTLSVGHGNFLAGATGLRQRAFRSALRQLRLRPDGASQGGFRRGTHRAQRNRQHIVAERRHLRQCPAAVRWLAGVVLLAEVIAAGVEDALQSLQVHQADAIVGAFIATLVLMPESLAAFRASLQQRIAAQPEHRAGFGLRDNWADDPCRLRRKPGHRKGADTRPGVGRHGASSARSCDQHPELRHWPDDLSYRPRSSRRLQRLRLPDFFP